MGNDLIMRRGNTCKAKWKKGSKVLLTDIDWINHAFKKEGSLEREGLKMSRKLVIIEQDRHKYRFLRNTMLILQGAGIPGAS
jgi:hypothetical protein